jgi:UDP-N-acetyl-D-glucosamine/UDP-N-acetyl-D-galactosamine dehydrogenase
MSEISGQKYESVILAVGHEEFREMGAEAIRALAKPDGILYDIKYVFPKNAVDGRL